MARLLSVAEDLRTVRLIRCAQAVKSAGLLPDDSAKMLLAQAQSLRYAFEAAEPALAEEIIGNIEAVLREDVNSGKDISSAALAALKARLKDVKAVLATTTTTKKGA